MKRTQRFCSVLLLMMVCVGFPLHAQSFKELWKETELAQKKSLPQTVIKLTDEIYRKGEREQNAPQMLKAYVFREATREQITPDSLYTHFKQLESWADTTQNRVNKAILHSLLARKYTHFVQHNRHTLLGRTALTSEFHSTDIREWSLPQLVHKIEMHNRASLQDSARLLAVSSREYVPFTELQEGSRFYQHDLYHLLASRAVATYNDLTGFDIDSLLRIRISDVYKNLINTYRHRANSEDAALLSSLNYWEWKATSGLNIEPYEVAETNLPSMSRAYLQALTALMEEYASREVCAEVYISQAEYLRKPPMNHLAEALKVCEEGLKRYPAYKRIGELRNIRTSILQPQLNVYTAKSIYPGDSLTLTVNYRNLKGFTLNLYHTNLSEIPRMENGINKAFYRKHGRKLSATHFVLKPLPQTDVSIEDRPYHANDTVLKLSVPDDLGVYVLQVLPDVDAVHTADDFLVSSRFKVLTLPLPHQKLEVRTLDARSGHPIADAQVAFYSSYEESARKSLIEVTTDADGKAVFNWNKSIRSYTVRKGKDAAMPLQYFYSAGIQERTDSRVQEHLTLLTDRTLYRPGQTIHVKGIAYEQTVDSAQVLEGKTYQLTLLDVNRKEIARKEVRTNEFGSFTDDFVLPAVCLNGNFTVEVKTKATTSVRVEEYKRPAFEIVFDPVKQAYKLGDTVTVKVISYNGMPVQDVPLAYSVSRGSYWRLGSSTPLASDTVQLDASGHFSIPVALRPGSDGLSHQLERGGVLSYPIKASVTSDAGETQTAEFSLQASNDAYTFVSSIPQELCKEDSIMATFRVLNAAQQVLLIKGIWRLYPLTNDRTQPMADKPMAEGAFISAERTNLSEWSRLPSGKYRLVLSVQNADGREVSNAGRRASEVLLFSLSDTRPPLFMNQFLYAKHTQFEATRPAVLYFGTSFKDVHLLIDTFGKNGRIESRTLTLTDSIVRIDYPYKEEYGDGISVQFTFVKDGQVYARRVELQKAQPNRQLDLKWEVFRDRLRPGQQEEWKLIIKNPQGVPAAAEMLATMYDASLDDIYKQNQSLRLYFNRYIPYYGWGSSHLSRIIYAPHFPLKLQNVPAWRFDAFYAPARVEMLNIGRYKEMGAVSRSMNNAAKTGLTGAPLMVADQMVLEESSVVTDAQAPTLQPTAQLRTNFAETAFFYPQLRTNEQGEVAFSFTMPQSLTRWNFRGYSHTKEMLTGMIDATTVTAKEFMLTPNMPRFVRIGDKTQIASSIANMTDKALKGTATLTLFDPMTEKVLATQHQKFAVEAGRTTTVDFHFEATSRLDLLGVRIVADGGAFSDGEQHLLPVLSNKEFITETLALPIRGEQTRTFALDSLFNRNRRTATNRRLTVEFTGNPAWYALQALPVLSLPANDNAVSWATAYYANSLAAYIANSQPRIKTVFDSWKLAGGTKETFLSQLEKNQAVKNILLNESPWLLEATTEAEQQARMATLFEINLLNGRNISAFTKLKELQEADGSWSWYKGMSGSRYLTSYITELLVRLPLLTQNVLPSEVAEMRQKAFGYLSKVALDEYRSMRKAEKSDTKITTLSDETLKYLYLMALSDEKVPAENQEAHRYFLTMIGRNLQNGTMVGKAQSSVILLKNGRKSEANEFIASIKEHLVQTDELGAHFAFYETPYTWGMLPISVQVEVMEALRMAGGNDALIEEMKLWLLKQKQTTSWNTPVATADVVYALLCQGSNLLDNRGTVRITLGEKVLKTLTTEQASIPGVGYLKETFVQGSPELKAKSITVQKQDAGIAWGAVYAQYLAPISEVKQQGGSLNIEKKLFVERVAANGKRSLQPVSDETKLVVGDKMVSRLTIRLDRSMDFVQLKDQRGACFEPIGSLSGYRWHNGLGYYMEVEDAATNFFFDHLGKGVHVLEHSYRIARGGTYEAGLATIQSAYAPEYASHSASVKVHVQR